MKAVLARNSPLQLSRCLAAYNSSFKAKSSKRERCGWRAHSTLQHMHLALYATDDV